MHVGHARLVGHGGCPHGCMLLLKARLRQLLLLLLLLQCGVCRKLMWRLLRKLHSSHWGWLWMLLWLIHELLLVLWH